MSHTETHDGDCCGDCESCVRCNDTGDGAPGIPISMASVGDRGTIVRISGREETRRFLAGLGFTTGTRLSAVCLASGSMILDVKGSKIAIDRNMANRIMFRPEV